VSPSQSRRPATTVRSTEPSISAHAASCRRWRRPLQMGSSGRLRPIDSVKVPWRCPDRMIELCRTGEAATRRFLGSVSGPLGMNGAWAMAPTRTNLGGVGLLIGGCPERNRANERQSVYPVGPRPPTPRRTPWFYCRSSCRLTYRVLRSPQVDPWPSLGVTLVISLLGTCFLLRNRRRGNT
jgi:hypothetical protein